MANVRKGQLIKAPQWARHLRPFWKRLFWKKHRRQERRETALEVQ